MTTIREIDICKITEVVATLCIESNIHLCNDTFLALEKAFHQEKSDFGKNVITDLLENAKIAKEENLPICQDTGLAVVYVEMGRDVHLNGDLYEAINEGVRLGYQEGYLRKSVVSDPVFDRKNTGDNTPAIINLKISAGDKIKITVAPKGGGSENVSALAMLTPSSGLEGVKLFVLETVKKAGPNACPPMAIIGIGIGGTLEKAASLAKESLLRPLGTRNEDPRYARLEDDILQRINDCGIKLSTGDQLIAALDVHIEWFPCHIASLPVAVNIQCNASRHKSMVI